MAPQGYKHTSAEVRKAVVFALVELQLVLGDELLPHLACVGVTGWRVQPRPHLGGGDSALSASQTKLLSIYVKRAQEKLSAA